ncbi:MAG: hypothetical protein E5Y88_26225 [Mesorhizobium sp.]|uniref:hypothetical protein n=1 Tax=Mesorhizobium TaxID=68287 RepID=UPI000FD39AC7|nr:MULTISPECIES: hypothetical protein [Mesorhizobium]RUV01680.1 hypothetical protein EOB36_12765 [Mesorhizobium sp. M6A.T.Cr.TU.017.01.1.1]RWN38441.1 MAG: hypothetical protein EOR96_22145 [Mesorhizobium sp.]RWN68328.1 MAG: hypothetical protein EOR99_08220 [Mesorhizobium sp.]RWP74352.1 MAG: hypothetical protein EOR09_16200 [Mesorhizobium sp.]RWQ39513.1 MAG: hypothetical protein EOS20_05070 [Mesorhizobium sp.]
MTGNTGLCPKAGRVNHLRGSDSRSPPIAPSIEAERYEGHTPKALLQMLGDPDRDKAGRVLQAMCEMKKIIIVDLERAYRG